MEDLIKEAFDRVDVLGHHVNEGHYDLFGPSGTIILPTIWAECVEPGMNITMTMWPLEGAKVAPPQALLLPMRGASSPKIALSRRSSYYSISSRASSFKSEGVRSSKWKKWWKPSRWKSRHE